MMFCPTCGLENPGDVRFCRKCGAHLHALREVLSRGTSRATSPGEANPAREQLIRTLLQKLETTDSSAQTMWGEPLVPKLVKQLDRLTISEEDRRRRHIRVGMVTMGVGMGVSLFLFLLFRTLTSTDLIPGNVAPIVNVLWVNGLIPFFIGLMTALYGLIPARRGPKDRVRDAGEAADLDSPAGRIPERTQLDFTSVTEHTTTRLPSANSEPSVDPTRTRSTREQ